MSFPTIVELTDFEVQMETKSCEVDRMALTISGDLSSREIEIAINAYFARLTEIFE